jgi:methionine-rich copper-binding protein CopC
MKDETDMTPTGQTLAWIDHLAIVFAMISLLGCSGGNNSSDNEPTVRSGTIAMRIAVAPPSNHSPNLAVNLAVSEPDICNDYLIDTITVQVYRAMDDAEVASAEEACAVHSLKITGVPAGEPLNVVCQGSMQGAPVWRGRKEGVAAETGQSTDIGVIQMQYIGSNNTTPEIASTFPPADAANVDVFSPVVVVFTEKLASGTITDQTIVVSNGDTPVPGKVDNDFDPQTIRFTPASAFQTETTYTVRLQSRGDVNKTITDIDGHPFLEDVLWQFTTRSAEDNAPPQVVATSPPSGDANVSPQTSITVLFSEPMNQESFVGDMLQVTSNQGAVSGKTAYDNQTRILTLKPDSDLKNGVYYTAALSVQARDLAQNPLAAPLQWKFLIGGYTIATSVTPESGCGGTIQPADAVVLHGEDITVDILIKPYHHLSGLIVDGVPVPPATDHTFEKVTENHTVQAIIKSNAKNIAGNCTDFGYESMQINAHGHVVWQGRNPISDSDPTPDFDIYYFDGSSTTNISEDINPDGHDWDPQINNQGHVVWRGRKPAINSDPTPDLDIFFFDGSNTTIISEKENPDGDDRNPKISDQGYVVWRGQKTPPGSDQLTDWDIYYYDGSEITNISEEENPQSDDWYSQISDLGHVVWQGRKPEADLDPAPDWDIYYYDRDTSTITNISENKNPHRDDLLPQINIQGDVVWVGQKTPSNEDQEAVWDIYYYDRGTSTATNISENNNPLGDDSRPQINAHGDVVWHGRKAPTNDDPDPDIDIYYYDRDTSTVTNISESENRFSDDSNPQINIQCDVVWFGPSNTVYYSFP